MVVSLQCISLAITEVQGHILGDDFKIYLGNVNDEDHTISKYVACVSAKYILTIHQTS